MKTLAHKPIDIKLDQYAWFQFGPGIEKTYYIYFWDSAKQSWIPGGREPTDPSKLEYVMPASSPLGLDETCRFVLNYLNEKGSLAKYVRLPDLIRAHRDRFGSSLREAAERCKAALDNLWMKHGMNDAGEILNSSNLL